jgi:urea transport system ATP-binding protein
MKRACRPLALLLIISTLLSAEELPEKGFSTLPPSASNTLEAMPLHESPSTVNAPPTLQVELLPVDTSVFETLSVFENLELALATNKGAWATLCARLNQTQRERIEQVLETIGLTEHRSQLAGILSHGQKQWLEIGMLLMQDPKVMLVDEPVAGMTHQEVERTAQLLLSLQDERSIVVVEHDMEFIRSIAQRVTVLHEGSVLTEGSMDEVQNDPRVIQVYLGD